MDVRKEILNILNNPTGVSDLKLKLKDVKSFGTIAYHLKNLKQEGLIDSFKDKSRRGNPTTYFKKTSELNEEEKEVKLKEMVKKQIDNQIIALKLLSNKGYVKEDLINQKALEVNPQYNGFELWSKIDELRFEKEFIEVYYKLNDKGEEFLKSLDDNKVNKMIQERLKIFVKLKEIGDLSKHDSPKS